LFFDIVVILFLFKIKYFLLSLFTSHVLQKDQSNCLICFQILDLLKIKLHLL
jgi:hypothetical protein